MAYLTRDEILTVQDRQFEDVEVPEWGGTVRLRGLTGQERDRLEASVISKQGKVTNLTNFRARLCALAIVDEDGERIFSDADVAALGIKSAAALERVFMAAQRLSGLSDDDVAELVGE
jgi:hypothetical protein